MFQSSNQHTPPTPHTDTGNALLPDERQFTPACCKSREPSQHCLGTVTALHQHIQCVSKPETAPSSAKWNNRFVRGIVFFSVHSLPAYFLTTLIRGAVRLMKRPTSERRCQPREKGIRGVSAPMEHSWTQLPAWWAQCCQLLQARSRYTYVLTVRIPFWCYAQSVCF